MSPAGWTWLPYPASGNIMFGAYLNVSNRDISSSVLQAEVCYEKTE